MRGSHRTVLSLRRILSVRPVFEEHEKGQFEGQPANSFGPSGCGSCNRAYSAGQIDTARTAAVRKVPCQPGILLLVGSFPIPP